MTKSRAIHFFAALTFVAVVAPVSSAAAQVPGTAVPTVTVVTGSGPAPVGGKVVVAREANPTGKCVACW